MIRKHGSVSWVKFKEWLQALSGSHDSVSVAAVQKSALNLLSKKQKVQKRSNIKPLLEAPYKMPQHQSKKAPVVARPREVPSTFMKEVVTTVNESLASENSRLEEMYEAGVSLLLAKEQEIARLKGQLRKVTHNMQRQIKRKNSKINECTMTIKHLQKSPKQEITRKLQDQVRYFKNKCESLTGQLKRYECNDCEKMETCIEELKQEKIELLHKNAEFNHAIKELTTAPKKLIFYQEGKYTDNLRMCVMELLSHNVGILNVEPIIKSVLTLAGFDYDKLPKHTTINEMLIESRSIAKMQLAETLTETTHTTLHSDGTSKHGHKYVGYQVSTEEGSLSLGLKVSFS